MSILLLLTNPAQVVQTTFLEPGGDATFVANITTAGGFWNEFSGPPTVATDFVHGNHVKSYSYSGGNLYLGTALGILASAGRRISVYLYFNGFPSATTGILGGRTAGDTNVFYLSITSGGVLQMTTDGTTQIGTNGSTLSTGQWYRISIAFTITDTTTNRFEVFKDGVSDISITNATILNSAVSKFVIGRLTGTVSADFRSSDHYIDNSASLTDTGDIWVTAKRPNANGTTNGFTTQIGTGGSGYGSGHSPQVNERALSIVNGWSMIGVGTAIAEQYNIESQSTGDINISTGTIRDYMGWVSAKALVAAGASITVNGVSTTISLTTAEKVFTKMAGSTTYPAGTGSDIGIITDTTLTTVSLYEAGIIVAYIPGATGSNNNQRFMLMGVS